MLLADRRRAASSSAERIHQKTIAQTHDHRFHLRTLLVPADIAPRLCGGVRHGAGQDIRAKRVLSTLVTAGNGLRRNGQVEERRQPLS